MDPDEAKRKINQPGCDDYRKMKKMNRPADHDEEIKTSSDDHQYPEGEEEEEEEKINRPDQDRQENKIRPLDDDDHDHEEAAAQSKIQALRFKIKLPKSEQQDQLVQCGCGKVFSSRKAWGGHWKMHLREEKEKENLNRIRNKQLIKSGKLLQSSISSGGGGGGGVCRFINAGDPVCSICIRKFKSWKSLFGHMRSHPDRGWKGIRPPPLVVQSGTAASDSPSATTSTPSHVVDLLRNLIGWTQTGKRGRPSTYCIASSLMNLAHSRPRIINSSGARIEESPSKRRKITISDSKTYLKSRDLKIGGGGDSDGDDSRVQEFKCRSCPRSFATFQALGGHRSSHNKAKSSDNNNVVESSMEDDSVEEENEDNTNADDSEETEEAHHCNRCDKSFSSGQALGGHKRFHYWKGPACQVAPFSGEEARQVVSNSVPNNNPDRKVLDFDLNELPDMDGDEEEI